MVTVALLLLGAAACSKAKCKLETGCSSKSPTSAKAPSPKPDAGREFIAVVDATYDLSIGWGNVYRCQVREVQVGNPPQQTFSLSVYSAPDAVEPDGPAGLPVRFYPSLVMRFRQRPDLRYGPPPGFKATDGTYWELVSVEEAREKSK